MNSFSHPNGIRRDVVTIETAAERILALLRFILQTLLCVFAIMAALFNV
jgi:hypothetical protein